MYYRDLGAMGAAPFIALDGDARGPGRQVVRITRPDRQGHVLICACSALGNGAGSLASYHARAVVYDGRVCRDGSTP